MHGRGQNFTLMQQNSVRQEIDSKMTKVFVEDAKSKNEKKGGEKVPIIKHYGVLVLPLIYMIHCGIFGCRPGQLTNRIVSYIINSLCVIIYITNNVFAICVIIKFHNTDDLLRKIFITLQISLMINFTFLMYIFYKKYNLLNLIKDIAEHRKCTLTKTDFFAMSVMLSAFLSMSIYISYRCFVNTITLFTTNKENYSWTGRVVITADPIANNMFAFFELFLYPYLSWVSLSCTSPLLLVMSTCTAREFSKCVSDCEQIITEKHFNHDKYSTFIKRFQVLVKLTNKVNDMFSKLVGLQISVSMGLLCGNIYVYLTEHYPINVFIIPMASSTMIVVALLSAPAAINSQVSSFVLLLRPLRCLFCGTTGIPWFGIWVTILKAFKAGKDL